MLLPTQQCQQHQHPLVRPRKDDIEAGVPLRAGHPSRPSKITEVPALSGLIVLKLPTVGNLVN